MVRVNVVRLNIPEDSPCEVAQRINDALHEVDRSSNTVLRMIFTVTPSRILLQKKKRQEFRDAVEPFREKVKYTCVENVIVLQNPMARMVARTSLFFLQPEIPTKVISHYFSV